MKNSHWEFFERKLVKSREHNAFYFTSVHGCANKQNIIIEVQDFWLVYCENRSARPS